MALSASTVWEVRNGGNDNNGGGFVTGASGTDFSQQDAAQDSGTNLTVDATTNTDVTPDGYVVSAADVGNLIQITAGAGFSVGFYQIVSIQGGTKWRLDRSPAATSTSGGTWAIGGAVATLDKLTNNGPVVAGNIIWIKGPTYTLTTTWTITVDGNTANGPIVIKGYGTTRGDGTRPVITSSTNSVTLITTNAASFIIFDTLKLTHTATTRGFGISGVSTGSTYAVINCIIDGCLIGINGDAQNDGIRVIHSLIENCIGVGLDFGLSSYVFNSCIRNNGGDGIEFAANGMLYVIVNNIITYNGANGIDFGANSTSAFIIGNIIAFNDGHGITESQGAGAGIQRNLIQNIIYGNGGYGINSIETEIGNYAGVFGLNYLNAYGNNVSGARNNYPVGNNDIDLTVDPFVDAAADDFNINNDIGGGALLRASSFEMPA